MVVISYLVYYNILLQNVQVIIANSTSLFITKYDSYYKMRQFYFKMRHYYEVRPLLQNTSVYCAPFELIERKIAL